MLAHDVVLGYSIPTDRVGGTEDVLAIWGRMLDGIESLKAEVRKVRQELADSEVGCATSHNIRV